jgi:hypothetical protein
MQALKALFPRNCANHSAITGLIPMSYFVANEAAIRKAAKEYSKHYRVIYRGPRASKNASMTRRGDATGALLYYA